jgi:hypothetical protein
VREVKGASIPEMDEAKNSQDTLFLRVKNMVFLQSSLQNQSIENSFCMMCGFVGGFCASPATARGRSLFSTRPIWSTVDSKFHPSSTSYSFNDIKIHNRSAVTWAMVNTHG